MNYKLIIIAVLFGVYGCSNATKTNTATTNLKEEVDSGKQLRHVVLFKFKDSAAQANILKVEAAFNALPAKIQEIKGYEWGLNNSPEGLNKGFTHCYFLTFNSAKDRDAYLIHPDHVAFGQVLSPYLDDVLVVDYWNE